MIELKIKLNKRANYNSASRLHGFIMQNIESEYASFLHENNYHPFTQYIENIDSDLSIWHLNLLDEEAIKKISTFIKVNDIIKLNNGDEYCILNIEKKSLTKNELLSELSVLKPSRKLRLFIKTPISFKTNNNYFYFLDIRLIFNSIINRYNMFSQEFTFEGVDIIDDIVENFMIIDYNIKTKFFYLEKTRIKGFIGNIVFNFGGSVQLANIGNMLLKYAEFTGIGIKTSIGMGGIQIDYNYNVL